MGTKENEIKKTDVIITAKVLSVESFSDKDRQITGLMSSHNKCKVKIIAVHKGKIVDKFLTIATTQSDCGYTFEIGKTYIIYGYHHKENTKDKYIYTGSCTRTSKFSAEEFNRITKYCKLKGYS